MRTFHSKVTDLLKQQQTDNSPVANETLLLRQWSTSFSQLRWNNCRVLFLLFSAADRFPVFLAFLDTNPYSTCTRVAQLIQARLLSGRPCTKCRPCISISWLNHRRSGGCNYPSSVKCMNDKLADGPILSVSCVRIPTIMFVWPPATCLRIVFFVFVYFLDSPAAFYLSVSARNPFPSPPRLCLALKLPSAPSHLPSPARGNKDAVAARPKQEVLLCSLTYVCCVSPSGCWMF